MKKLETLQKLPKCDTEIGSEQLLLEENNTYKLAPCRFDTDYTILISDHATKLQSSKQYGAGTKLEI